mgnify:CR=1 FL=1
MSRKTKSTAADTAPAEAVENAVKFARAYTGRSDVIAFNGVDTDGYGGGIENRARFVLEVVLHRGLV